MIAQMNPNQFPVMAAAVSQDGTVAATANWGEEPVAVRAWRLGEPPTVLSTALQPNMVASLAFSPDAQTLAVAPFGRSQGTVLLLDHDTGRARTILSGHQGAVPKVVFSADGGRLATASADATVKIWEATTGALLRSLDRMGEVATDVAFDFSGDYLATSASSGSLRLWDVATGSSLARIETGQHLLGFAFTPDARNIVAVSDTSLLEISLGWALTTRGNELRHRICAEKLVGASAFASADTGSPFLRTMTAATPCDQVGPLSRVYWSRAATRMWHSVRHWAGTVAKAATTGM